jgi:hypothetical protein
MRPCADLITALAQRASGGDADAQAQLNDIVKFKSNAGKLPGDENEVTATGEIYDPNENQADADKICSILINDQLAGPALKFAKQFQLWLNAIPSVELSRAVPYISIQFQGVIPPEKDVGRLGRTSLVRFLAGGLRLGDFQGPANQSLANVINNGGLADATSVGGGIENVQLELEAGSFASGMEMFTSPQTLVNIEDARLTGNAAVGVPQVIDPYRPLMSIDSLRFDGVGEGLAPNLSRETGELNLILHDRSRLTELADMIAVGGVAPLLRITYGWNHPDGPAVGNAYGDFINGLKKTAIFSIANYNMSMEQDGSVRISMKIFDAAAATIYRLRVADSQVPPALATIKKIQSVLEYFTKSLVADQGKEKAKSLNVNQILESVGNDYGQSPEIQEKLKPFFEKYLKRGNFGEAAEMQALVSEEDIIAFIEVLEEKLGPSGDGSDGEPSADPVPHLTSQADGVVQAKFDALLGQRDNPDRDTMTPEKTSRSDQPPHPTVPPATDRTTEEESGPALVSLGKFMTNFVAPAIIQDDFIDQIQFVFFPFNDQCGDASDRNIASFMFEFEELKKAYIAKANSLLTYNMTLTQVFSFINELLRDSTQRFYGASVVRSGNPKPDPGNKPSAGAAEEEATTGNPTAQSPQDKQLEKKGEKTFRPPNIQFRVMTRPIVNQGEDGVANQSQKMGLRIEIFDRSASPWRGASSVLKSAVENELVELGKTEGKTADAVVKAAENSGLIRVDDLGVVRLNAPYPSIKGFLKSVVPSVTYGANNSQVLDAGVATLSQGDLRGLAIQRLFKQGVSQPIGTSANGVPLIVQSVKVDTTIMGFPFLSPSMEMFWDFGTNTSIDQLYGCVRYSHEISAGKFTTAIDWVPTSGYAAYQTTIGQLQAAKAQAEKIRDGDGGG